VRSRRALITSPQILLLTAPFGARSVFAARMRTELKKPAARAWDSFIHVTHGQDEAMALADIVVLMNGGRIEQQEVAARNLQPSPHRVTAKFIGGHNVITIGDEVCRSRNRLKLKDQAKPSTSV